MKPLVRVAALSGYVEFCQSLGVAPQVLMEHTCLDVAALAEQDTWISGTAVADLLERSAAATHREDFGLHMAEYRRLSNLGPLSLVAREEPDVRGAVRLILDYEHMYNEVLRTRLDEREGLATLTVHLELGEKREARQLTELAVATFHRLVGHLLGRSFHPLSVSFTHGEPADTDTHDRLFGPVARFGQAFDGVVFYAAELDAPNVLADPLLHTYARKYFEAIVVPRETTEVDRVRELIETLLPAGRCSLEHVAHSLGVDRRTVHRRLADAGETFSSVLTATRRQLAEQFVANPRKSLTEVSGLLGFSTPSAFSRWFREQFGCSAQQWRRRRSGQSPSDIS
ncbi:AraC family transcriptional regulator [Streptomyces sp. 110]|uniref:AraC family transcriptional regulator n=1 Tax=Streptomyces endocoffeicus TaxID=2898945 RepID=A0ABS1PJ92_9ACTN|nr:AraC family transcriptional regulator [Streptomyces endocoffeicus]MBL1112472.1 AraC family transcriptional regulator [Streptomyces endocoffeicus]